MQPTKEAYSELEQAYDFYNAQLFAKELPSCLLTLQRKSKRVMGYFSPERFDRANGDKSDELAMNPMHFNDCIDDVLSTLVHEMVHVWQHHKGKSGRGNYHNKQWATKMKAVGLHPSKTGKAGGKETGDQMTHFIVANGAFDVVTKDLLRRGFLLSWAEFITVPAIEGGEGGSEDVVKQDPDKSNRVKYQCPQCENRAWGKLKLLLICGKCRVDYRRC